MTVEAVTKTSVKAIGHSSNPDHDPRGCTFYAKCRALGGEMDADQESACSSEDIESPRSVVRKYWPSPNVHTQILRIREEDSLIGQDFVAENVKKNFNHRKVDRDHVFILSHTPINRPASPLSRSK